MTAESTVTWYAAHTHAQAEAKAAWHLENQGFQFYLPRYLKRRRHARKTDWVKAPLFPRYLFIGVTPENLRWRAINSTIGIHYLVSGRSGEPTPIPTRIIDAIRAREDEDGNVALGADLHFRKGEVVKILDGPMTDAIGLFDIMTDDERVVVLLDLMGRQVRVRLPGTAICAVV